MDFASPDLTDEALAARVLSDRGPAAFEALVRRYQVPLLHYLQSITGDRHDAEDALQEVFVKLLASMRRFDPRWPFRAWAFTIAYRHGITHLRRQPKRVAGWPPDVHAESPAATAIRSDDRERLWTLARVTLSPEQYTAVWLHYVEDAGLAEIARVLDKSNGAVKVMLHRARTALAARIESDQTLRPVNR